ncbi:MAG: hypothetical protein KKB50_09160 [Planctomycetes bacterium]|nr:hypothetical protein [Planctomycetota bacterium]
MCENHRRWPVAFLSTLLSAFIVLPCAAVTPPGQDTQATSDPPPREQTIYIPYEKLREVFEREGRGVFLPYEEFQALWRAAREATAKPPEPGPPVAAMITAAHSEATVAEDVVQVRAQLSIEVLAEGWHEIPLRLGDAAIISATLGNEPARIVAGAGGYVLLLEKRGAEPELLELVLEYAKAYHKSPGQNSVSFAAPQAPVNRWRVRIPEAGVKVNIHPLIAATEVPEGERPATQPAETTVLAFVGAAPAVQIDWTPRAEGATGLKALVTVRADQRVWIHEGVTRSRTQVVYEISRAAVDRLVLKVPADHKVVNVYDANVRQWSVRQADTLQEITVELFEPAQGSQSVVIELEQFSGDQPRTELAVPVIRAVDVGRQQGFVAVAVADGLRVEATRRSGLMQVDAAELSAAGETPAENWELSYRYVTVPFELVLRVEKIEPRITVDALVEAYLEPDEVRLELQALYTIEKAGVFQLELDLPAGYDLRNPRGVAVAGANPVVVESWHRGGEGQTRLIVNLGRKALGRVGFGLTLSKRLKEPNLLKPTGQAAQITIPVPQVALAPVEQATGRLVVYAAESLRVSPAQMEGLRSIALTAALDRLPADGPPDSKTAGAGGLAFAFAQDPATLVIKAERRRPHSTVRQLLAVRIESGVVKHSATFFYDIRYSAVELLRIDVPAHLAGVIQNNTARVRETLLDDPQPPPADGYVAWGLRGDAGFVGQVKIELAWEAKIDALDVGKSVEVEVPHLKPVGVDRDWGQVVLAKAETLDIRATGGDASEAPLGLQPVDPQHDLMEGAERLAEAGAARAFEFHDDWVLVVHATRYELEEIKRTSIERALVRAVITRSKQVSVQALYRMRSTRQRLPVGLPAGVEFDNDPVRINGRPVALERGGQDEFFVPLAGQSPDAPFVLELRYTVPAGGTTLACPTFPTEPAVQKVYLNAYLPAEWTLLGSTGPWTDELDWRWRGAAGYQPRSKQVDASLVAWVIQGVSAGGNPLETFQTDGQAYLFSTLRPPAPPAGELTLVTMPADWFAGIVVATVVLGGLILLRARASTRLLASGGLLATLILAGVFLPTFALQLLDGILFSALLVVVLGWLVMHLAWTRPRDPDVRARREARQKVRMAQIYARLPQTVPPAAPKTPLPADEPKAASKTQDKPASDAGKGGREDA